MRLKSKQLGPILVLLLLLGCASQKPVTSHPNQFDQLEGSTYDSLIIHQASLDEAKAQYAQGKLPPTAKTAINAAGAAYSTAHAAWQLRYDAVHGKNSADVAAASAALQADMTALAQAITAMKAATGGK